MIDKTALDIYMENFREAQRMSIDETLDKRGDRYGDYRNVAGLYLAVQS